MKQLRGLDLNFARLTDGDAEHLGELPNLRELHCFGWTHKGFDALGKCEQFEVIRVLDSFDEKTDNADLAQTLWISSSKITDDGLAHLASLVELTEVNLPESITPQGLRHLEKLQKLQRLQFLDWVYAQAITDSGTNPGRTTNKARAHLRAIVAWAWDQDLIDSLPRFPSLKSSETLQDDTI